MDMSVWWAFFAASWAISLLAARVLRSLSSTTHVRWMNRGFGALFVVAGLLLAGFKRSA